MTDAFYIPVIYLDPVENFLKYKGASKLDALTIDWIVQHGKISVEEHEKLHNISWITSLGRIERLEKAGIIKNVTPANVRLSFKQEYGLNMPVEDMIAPSGAFILRRKVGNKSVKTTEPVKAKNPPGVWYIDG